MADAPVNPFAYVLEDVRRRNEAIEAHRATCSKRPCEECCLWLCPTCKAEMPTPDGVSFVLGEETRSGVCHGCANGEIRAYRLRPALASVPAMFRWARFTAHELRARVLDHEAIRAAYDAKRSARVILIGEPGAGKTSLAAAMLNEYLDAGLAPDAKDEVIERARRARFYSAYQLVEAEKVHPLGKGVAPLIQDSRNASILVIDELGAERDPAVIRELIYDRHKAQQPTWLTTFLTNEQIEDRYGGGTERRMFEKAREIRVGFPKLKAVL